MTAGNIFKPHRRGWVVSLSPAERSLLSKAISEVVDLLDAPVLPFSIADYLDDKDQINSVSFAQTDRNQSGVSEKDLQQSQRELAFSPRIENKLQDTSLERLLPVASPDNQLADEFESLTDNQLRTLKSDRLKIIWQEIISPSGGENLVLVRRGQEMIWLGGLNDVRLAISARLQISNKEQQNTLLKRGEELLLSQLEDGFMGVEEGEEPVVLMLYAQLSRWQESLLRLLEDMTLTDNLEE